MRYYPVYLNIQGRKVLLVGAGAVALQKIPALLEGEAKICIVAPEATEEIRELAHAHQVDWLQRGYQTSDLEGCAFVIAATDDPELQKQVAAEARARGLWVNVVDVTPLCDFIAPAVIGRGDVQIAISTAGASPALAKFIRQKLEPLLGEEYAQLAELLQRYRPTLLKLPKEKRQAIWDAIINNDFLTRIKKEGIQTADARIRELLHG